MRVDEWSYYSVDRPPVKFRRIWSPFGAPTDNYSNIITGLFVGRFRSPETVAGPLSLLFSQLEPFCTAHKFQPTPRVRVRNFPGPDPDSCHRWVRIIPKHLQNVSVSYLDFPSLYILNRRILIG